MIGRDLSKIEANVLNLIINRASFEEPIKASKVRQETGLSKRSLEEVIESLRVNFKHPIVAKKNTTERILSSTKRGRTTSRSGTVQASNFNGTEKSCNCHGS